MLLKMKIKPQKRGGQCEYFIWKLCHRFSVAKGDYFFMENMPQLKCSAEWIGKIKIDATSNG